MRNYIPFITTIFLMSVTNSVLSHPLSMGRLNLESEKDIITFKLEIDFHSCEHLLGSPCNLSTENSKTLFTKSIGAAPVTYNGKNCVWKDDQTAQKVSSELLGMKATAECKNLSPEGTLYMDLAFLKKLGSKYHLMAKTKIAGVERMISATPKEPFIKLNMGSSKK